MGYCTYAGKLVPGGDAAGCIGGGGDWVDTEHTPSYGPGDGQKRGFITPASGQDLSSSSQLGNHPMGLPTRPIGKSYSMGQGVKRGFITPASGWDLSSSSQLGSYPMNLPTRPIGTSYGMGQGVQRSFLEPGLGYPDTDDFGNPLSTDFEGNTNFGLLRDRSVDKFNAQQYNKPFNGEVTRTDTSQPRMVQTENGLRPMTEQEMIKSNQYGAGQNLLNTFPMVSSIFGNYSDENAAINSARGGDDIDMMTNSVNSATNSVVDSFNSAIDSAKLAYEKATLPEVPSLLRPRPATVNSPIGPLNEKGIFQKSDSPMPPIPPADVDKGKEDKTDKTDKNNTPTAEEVMEVAKGNNNSTSLMDNIQSKDWWMSPTKGGAGAWDNRLFRLGEMMAHMGTPLSKRGDSPAKRWTTTAKDSAVATATINAAQAKKEKSNMTRLYNRANLDTSNVAASILHYLPKKGWFTRIYSGMSEAERKSYSKAIVLKAEVIMNTLLDANPPVQVSMEQALIKAESMITAPDQQGLGKMTLKSK